MFSEKKKQGDCVAISVLYVSEKMINHPFLWHLSLGTFNKVIMAIEINKKEHSVLLGKGNLCLYIILGVCFYCFEFIRPHQLENAKGKLVRKSLRIVASIEDLAILEVLNLYKSVFDCEKFSFIHQKISCHQKFFQYERLERSNFTSFGCYR